MTDRDDDYGGDIEERLPEGEWPKGTKGLYLLVERLRREMATQHRRLRDDQSVMREIIRKDLETAVKELRADFKADYVTQNEFLPVSKVVYGMVFLALVAVAGAIIALVVKPTQPAIAPPPSAVQFHVVPR